MAAPIASIRVALDLHLRFDPSLARGEAEAEVLDGQAAVEPLLLVVCADGARLVEARVRGVGVEVGRAGRRLQLVHAEHFAGVSKEKRAVGLEVDAPALLRQDAAVERHEAGAGEAFPRLLHLRIGEGDPEFVHFARLEKAGQKFDVGPKEGHVAHLASCGHACAGPHAGALDVDADEVRVRVPLSQSEGVFPAPTAQFEHDAPGPSAESGLPPATFQGAAAALGQRGVRVLEDVGQGFHLGEFLEFIS